jgi:hypothetical protein
MIYFELRIRWTYRSGTVVSYECIHERSEVSSVLNTPVFHDHRDIESSAQLELFDLSQFQLCYALTTNILDKTVILDVIKIDAINPAIASGQKNVF